MSEADYRAHPSLSQSEFAWLLKSELHFQYRKDLTKETEAMRFGTAFHKAVLEPTEFKTSYGVLPEFWGTTQDGKPSTQSKDAKEKKRIFLEKNKDKLWLSDDDMSRLTFMLNSMSNNEDINELGLLAGGESEVVAVWERNGVACKGRIDKFFPNHPKFGRLIVELKSASDASEESFAKEMHKRHYDHQAAFYDYAFKPDNYLAVVVESSFPCPIGIYNLKPWLELGNKKNEKCFERLKNCTNTSTWAGYTRGVKDSMPPSWLIAQLEDQIED